MIGTTWAKGAMALGLVGSLLGGCAADTAKSTDDRLARAESTFGNFRSDPEMKWFRDNVGKARAVVIAPNVTRAGFIVGGSGGEALVLARDKGSGAWAGPAYYNMGTASVGLLAGVDVSEIVILVMTEKALDGLLSSDFTLGGDASVTAGPVGVGAASTITADMVAFSRAKGVFGGLSLDGAVIKPDMGANAAYYGSPASAADILVRHSVNNPSSAGLLRAVSMTAQ